jgi:valyl-tRNA synthetase
MPDSGSIIHSPLPQMSELLTDKQAHADFEKIKSTVTAIRCLRSEIGISPATLVSLYLNPYNEQSENLLITEKKLIMLLAKVNSIESSHQAKNLTATATTQSELAEMYIPLEGLINKKQELDRLSKQIAQLKKDHEKTKSILANERYLQQAPPEIIAKENGKLKTLSTTLDRLSEHYQVIEKL